MANETNNFVEYTTNTQGYFKEKCDSNEFI